MLRLILISCLMGMGSMLIQPGSASAQSLKEAIELAYANNPQLAAQREATVQSTEQITQARSFRRPSVTASGSYGFESVDSNRPFGVETGERAVAQAQVEASLPIYTGGRLKAGIRQAEAGYTAALAELEAEVQSLLLNTVIAYMDVSRDRDTIAIRENSVALLTQQLTAAQDRFEVGVVTRTDVAQAEARLEGTRAALAGAQSSLEASIANYIIQVGELPGRLDPRVPVPVLPETREEVLQLALQDSPELLAARAAERAAEEAIRVAESELKPTVAIVGTARAQETYDENFRDTSLTAVAQASVPLFQGGLLRSQVRSAKSQRDQARLQRDVLTRQIRAQVAQAWYGHLAALQAIEASKRQIQAAEIAYEGAQEELSVGVRTTLDVLDQEQQLLDARLSLVESQRDAVVSAYQVLRVSGQLDLSVFAIESR